MALFGDDKGMWCVTMETETVFTTLPFIGDYFGAHWRWLQTAICGSRVGSGLVRFDRTNMIRLTPRMACFPWTRAACRWLPMARSVWRWPGALTRYDGTNFTHFTARDGVPSEAHRRGSRDTRRQRLAHDGGWAAVPQR
jgi:hypothetical protein